jgi:tellurite resistance protein
MDAMLAICLLHSHSEASIQDMKKYGMEFDVGQTLTFSAMETDIASASTREEVSSEIQNSTTTAWNPNSLTPTFVLFP